MLYRSAWKHVTTLPLSHDKYGNDREIEFEHLKPRATTITLRFAHVHAGHNYYALWSLSEDFSATVHRSKALRPDAQASLGTMLEKEIAGLTPDTDWFFKVVSNPDVIAGEQ